MVMVAGVGCCCVVAEMGCHGDGGMRWDGVVVMVGCCGVVMVGWCGNSGVVWCGGHEVVVVG